MRRDLIPDWMKIFVWLYIILGILNIFEIMLSVFGLSFWFGSVGNSMYGMMAEQYSFLYFLSNALLFFKFFIAYSMWTEKDWAFKLAIVDASIGILICILVQLIVPILSVVGEGVHINIRFELLLLIPYLTKSLKMRKVWETYYEIPEVDNSPKIEIPEIEEPKVDEIHIDDDGFDKEDPRRFMPK